MGTPLTPRSTPSFTVKASDISKPDESLERAKRRLRAEQINADLRYAIESRVAERVGPMQKVKRG